MHGFKGSDLHLRFSMEKRLESSWLLYVSNFVVIRTTG